MNDQTQQQPSQPPSNQTAGSSAPASSRYNPWEGTADPAEAGTGEGQQQQTTSETSTTQGVSVPDSGVGAQTGAQPSTGTGAQTPPVQNQQPGLSASDLSKIVAETVAGVVPQALQQQQQAQPQFTEQDFVKTFNVFQPTPEILASIGLPATPEAAAAFTNISTAIVRQAATMAAYQMERLKQEMVNHVKDQLSGFEPARQMAMERQTEQMKQEFFTQYPDLQGYDPLILEIRDRLVGQGVQFKTKDEAFKTVAEHARGILKKIPGLAANGNQNQTQPNTTVNGGSRMSALSGAGQGGSGTSKNGSGGRKKTTAETLFGG